MKTRKPEHLVTGGVTPLCPPCSVSLHWLGAWLRSGIYYFLNSLCISSDLIDFLGKLLKSHDPMFVRLFLHFASGSFQDGKEFMLRSLDLLQGARCHWRHLMWCDSTAATDSVTWWEWVGLRNVTLVLPCPGKVHGSYSKNTRVWWNISL